MIAGKKTRGAFQRQDGAVALLDERRDLLVRVVHSQTFGRSERLGALLTYVCEMYFEGRANELNEQRIGQAVFERKADYDSAVDGIVRSQASRLRQRLELYFQDEGAAEPLRVSIPRGGYVPVFDRTELLRPVSDEETREQRSPAGSEAKAVAAHRTPVQLFLHWKGLLPWALIPVVAVAVSLVSFRYRSSRADTAGETVQKSPFWGMVLPKNQVTPVITPDSGLVLFHSLTGQKLELKEYLDGGYRSGMRDGSDDRNDRGALVRDLANRRYTSMVDVGALMALKDEARTSGSDISVHFARDVRPNTLKSKSVILLGSAMANPWVGLYEHNMNFALEDDDHGVFRVINRHPKSGEPSQWESLRNDGQRRVFGVVSFMPGLEGNSSALILEGTTMSGTEASTDFIFDESQIGPFLARVRRKDGSLPHFELVLETHNMGASAVQSQTLAWRVTD